MASALSAALLGVFGEPGVFAALAAGGALPPDWFTVADQRFQWPVDSCKRTGGYWHQSDGYYAAHGEHTGSDFQNMDLYPDRETDADIYAVASGWIAETRLSNYESYGLWVKILHPNGTWSHYAHMSKVNTFSRWQWVDRGTKLGKVGTTNGDYPVDPHCHLGLAKSKEHLTERGADKVTALSEYDSEKYIPARFDLDDPQGGSVTWDSMTPQQQQAFADGVAALLVQDRTFMSAVLPASMGGSNTAAVDISTDSDNYTTLSNGAGNGYGIGSGHDIIDASAILAVTGLAAGSTVTLRWATWDTANNKRTGSLGAVQYTGTGQTLYCPINTRVELDGSTKHIRLQVASTTPCKTGPYSWRALVWDNPS